MFRMLIDSFRAAALGSGLRRALRRHEDAASRLDEAVRRVLGE